MKVIFFIFSITALFTENLIIPLSLDQHNPQLTVQNLQISSPAFDLYVEEAMPVNEMHLEQKKKNVAWAVILSSTIPGLGHVYLEDLKTASWQTGSGLLVEQLSHVDNPNVSMPSYYTISNLYMYSIYSAYRDARIYNRNDGYKYQMATDSFTSLLTAPFSWTVFKKPEVWGGILGSLGVATIAHYACFSNTNASITDIEMPFLALPIAIGEEAFFRGFLQPLFSEYAGTRGGIYLSALAFGAAHTPNALLLPHEDRANYYLFSLPIITAFGAYAGWLTEKNHSLREAVAIHAWYDFTLFSLSLLGPKAKVPQKNHFSFSIPF